MSIELFRKGIHTSLALFFALFATLVSKELVVITAFLLFIGFVALRLLRVHAHVGMVPRVTFGELFFAIGVAGTALLALPNTEVFIMAMFILALSDPLAALVGMHFGTHKYVILDEKRTIEGSTTCFLVSLAVFLVFGTSVYISIFTALLITLIEVSHLGGQIICFYQ